MSAITLTIMRRQIESTPMVPLARCISAAKKVDDIDTFRTWSRDFVRPVVPHGALACGHGRIHSAGVSMDYVVAVDYPVEHLAAISNAAGAIDTPLMRRWLATRKPVFSKMEISYPGHQSGKKKLRNRRSARSVRKHRPKPCEQDFRQNGIAQSGCSDPTDDAAVFEATWAWYERTIDRMDRPEHNCR